MKILLLGVLLIYLNGLTGYAFIEVNNNINLLIQAHRLNDKNQVILK